MIEITKIQAILRDIKRYQHTGLSTEFFTVLTAEEIEKAARGILQSDLASQPKPELPLLTDAVIGKVFHDNDVYRSMEFALREVAKTQRDADLRAIGTCKESLQVEKWQEKPDRPGWWVRWEFFGQIGGSIVRTQQLNADDITYLSKRNINAKWLFIPEPKMPEGKK
jgi:hypothetical protein